MVSIQNKLKELISQAAGVVESQIVLEHPEAKEHGDYSTNIALLLKGGRVKAEEIVAKIQADFIAKVEVAGPGFINIYLKPEVLIEALDTSAKLPAKLLAGQKIMVEFGQPNTHKMPHIGHLFSYIYGEAVCRLLEATGVTVRRVNYQGDVGLHVAKCLWAYRHSQEVEQDSLEAKVRWLQKLYQTGSQAYDDNPEAKIEIGHINKQIYAHDSAIEDVWVKTRGWSEQYYQSFEKRLGISYDHYYWESQVAEKGKQLVEEQVGKVFEKSQGAIVYTKPHTRVFVTSEGNPTYEAKDTALEQQKMQDWPCDRLIITTASEQNAYFEVVFAALEELKPDLKGKLKHIGFGMVNLKSGKMASRTGNIIGAVDLVEMVVKEAGKVNRDVAEEVGLGAIKYAFLKKGAESNMEFDITSSIAVQGNSGPYLQYTYARTQSVLRKAKSSNLKAQRLSIEHLALSIEESAILRWIYRYQEIVEEAATRYAPNLVCTFLYELAQRFNTFYNKHSILSAETQDQKDCRLQLTRSVGEVLNSGLNLLGITVLRSM